MQKEIKNMSAPILPPTSLTKMRIEALKRAREEFQFHNVWTYVGKIIYKHLNDNKIKIYYDQKINFEYLLQVAINGNHLCWKSSSHHFVYLYFCFVLGFLGLSFTGNAPLIFCFELIFCFKAMPQSIVLVSLFFVRLKILLSQISNAK